MFFGYYQPNYTAYGTLRIQINPDVEMTVSRTDRVLDLEGLNADGEDLIEGYDYRGKDRETAAGELVERAIDMGYLSDGDTISITVSSSDADWQAREEAQVQAQLEERYGRDHRDSAGRARQIRQPAGSGGAGGWWCRSPPGPSRPDAAAAPRQETGYGPRGRVTDYETRTTARDGVTDYATRLRPQRGRRHRLRGHGLRPQCRRSHRLHGTVLRPLL